MEFSLDVKLSSIEFVEFTRQRRKDPMGKNLWTNLAQFNIGNPNEAAAATNTKEKSNQVNAEELMGACTTGAGAFC